MHAKFEVSSFNLSRDMDGSQNFKSRSRDPFMTPAIRPNFAFFSRMAPVINLSVKFDANIFIGDRYMAIFTTSPI